jgi:hypothetical protein
MASLKLRRWRFLLYPESNDLAPDQELVAVRVGNNILPLDPGRLRASRNRKVFSFKAAKDDPTPLRKLRLKKRRGEYSVSVTVRDIELSDLVLNDGVCVPMAVLVGDDDAFSGGFFVRPGFGVRPARRVRILRSCPSEWPSAG